MRNYIIMMILIALAFAGCSAPRQKLNPQGNVDFKTAQVYYAQQNIEKAEDFYNRVLETNPGHAISMRRLADINLHKGETYDEHLQFNKNAYELYDAALTIYEGYENLKDEEKIEIRDMKKRRESAWVRIFKAGEKEQKDGNTMEAKEIFELASALDRERPQPIILLKDIYMKDLNDPENAERLMLELLKKDPKNKAYLLETGAFYYNAKDFAKAAQYFEEVRKIEPADVDNLMNLSYAYYEVENYQKALEITRQALALQPANLDILDNAKSISLQLKDYASALEYMDEILEHRSTEQDFSEAVMISVQEDDYESVIRYAKRWHAWDDLNPAPVEYIILSAQKMDDQATAKAFSDILKMMPKN